MCATRIVKTVSAKVVGGSVGQLGESLGKVIDAAKEYAIVREQEVTKRELISAHRDVMLEQIRSNRELLQLAIDRTFDERGKVLDRQFEALDAGLASGDSELIRMALDSIVDVVKSTPFKNIQELRTSLADPGFTLELE